MSAYLLQGAPVSVSGGGELNTSNTSATPIPAGIDWSALSSVFYQASGDQTIVNGTYSLLALAGSGMKTTSGTVNVNGTLELANAAVTAGTITYGPMRGFYMK